MITLMKMLTHYDETGALVHEWTAEEVGAMNLGPSPADSEEEEVDASYLARIPEEGPEEHGRVGEHEQVYATSNSRKHQYR